MHPDDLPRAKAALDDALARSAANGGGAVPLSLDRRLKRPDGSWAWLHTSGSQSAGRSAAATHVRSSGHSH
jgi:hypothetical protein